MPLCRTTKRVRVLLVGGPLDGTWREVDVSEPLLAIGVPTELTPVMPPTLVEVTAEVTLKQHIYDRLSWTMIDDERQSCVRHVYVEQGMSPAQLFDRLLAAYTPQNIARDGEFPCR